MDLHAIKQKLQQHLTDGLLIIVGCGLSSAEGVPGMEELGQNLLEEMPKQNLGQDAALWDNIANCLIRGDNIEQAMLSCPSTVELENLICDLTAELILRAETSIVDEIFAGKRTMRFTRLLTHLLKPNTGIPVLTTNYDRLIEIASEMAGLRVDTLFVGQIYGVFNERESRMSFCRDITKRGGAICLTYADRVVVLKPHGSLDWYLHNGEPIRCPLPLAQPRLMITPGLSKFRSGYNLPFDRHREMANARIDGSARYLIIGYGFNDDHLETHLTRCLHEGRPALLLTRALSRNAKKLIAECKSMFALTAGENQKESGVHFVNHENDVFFSGPNLWDLGVFVEEVLEP